MAAAVRPIIAQTIQPPLILLKNGKGKIKLRLRRMNFQRELNELPSDLKQLVGLMIQSRARINGGIYETVTIWNKLRNYKEYWVQMQCSSEAQFLAKYSLPDGASLAHWTVMVNLFEKETFILLGEEVLLGMMRSIGEYQNDSDKRKGDYQMIFDRYCREYDNFDQIQFRKAIRSHIIERYEKPAAKKSGTSHENWLKKKVRVGKKTTHFSTTVEAPVLQEQTPRVQHDYEWKQDACIHCGAKIQTIKDLLAHLRTLERFIAEKIGESEVPERPTNLDALEDIL